MIDFLTIILLIFGVLQIILFFKVWGMTNDIKDIRNKYLKDEDEKQRKNTEYDAITKIRGQRIFLVGKLSFKRIA